MHSRNEQALGGGAVAGKEKRLLKDVNDLEHKLYECVGRRNDVELALIHVETEIAAATKALAEKRKALTEAEIKRQEQQSFVPEPHMLVEMVDASAQSQSQTPLQSQSPKPSFKEASPDQGKEKNLLSLPLEIRLRILALLPKRDLQSVACTCKRLQFDCRSPRLRDDKLKEALMSHKSTPALRYSASGFSALTSKGHSINGINIINSRGVLSDDEWQFRMRASGALPAFLLTKHFVIGEHKESSKNQATESDSDVLKKLDSAITLVSSPVSENPPPGTYQQPNVSVILSGRTFKVSPPGKTPSATKRFTDCSKISKVLKVALYGPSRCGKTSLINCFEGQTFDPIGSPTTTPYCKVFGFQTVSPAASADPSSAPAPYALQLWDCSRKPEDLVVCFKGAKSIVICYVMNDPDGLKACEPSIARAKQYISQVQNPPRLYLVGCKADGPRKVAFDAAQAFAQANGVVFIGECSSRTKTNVEAVFCAIAHRALNNL